MGYAYTLAIFFIIAAPVIGIGLFMNQDQKNKILKFVNREW